MRRFSASVVAGLLGLALWPLAAWTQDAGAMAAQQANMAAQQANMQATQASQLAAQQANDQAMQNARQALDNCGSCAATRAPQFSVAPGAYAGAQLVRLKTKSRAARIFYTTDGWTPTIASIAYAGPITVAESETIQAIAVSPGAARSVIAKAEYRIASSASAARDVPTPRQVAPNQFELPQNTPLPLVFTGRLDSETAAIGDVVQLALATDLVVNGTLIAAKGTPATARVSAVDPAGRMSLPGVISFTLGSIRINGVEVPLAGTRTREGPTHLKRQAFLLIPAVGAASLLKKGDPVEIAPNTPVTALVAGNTEVPAQPVTPAGR